MTHFCAHQTSTPCPTESPLRLQVLQGWMVDPGRPPAPPCCCNRLCSGRKKTRHQPSGFSACYKSKCSNTRKQSSSWAVAEKFNPIRRYEFLESQTGRNSAACWEFRLVKMLGLDVINQPDDKLNNKQQGHTGN